MRRRNSASSASGTLLRKGRTVLPSDAAAERAADEDPADIIVLLEKQAARKMSIFLDSNPSNPLATSFISSYEINRSPLAYFHDSRASGAGRTWTLRPSTRSTGGLRKTRSPSLTPALTLTVLSKSRATVTGRMRAMPPSTTATLKPSPLKTIASDGTISDGVVRGTFSSTVQ